MKSLGSHKIFAAAVALIFAINIAGARQLTPEQALKNASIEMPRSAMSSDSRGTMSCKLAYSVESGNVSTVYVFNRSNGGFYVVAADDAAPQGLLGYTDSGEFKAESAPANLMGILENYSNQVAYAATCNDVCEPSSADSRGRGAIAPMLNTRWGQTQNYARFTPEINGTHCQTGCVATAMGQIIYYHKYLKAHGSITYQAPILNKELSYDFNKLNIDFNVIEAAGNSVSTENAANEVGKLLAACGYAAKMNYSTANSTSSIANAANAFANYLGYDKGIRNLNRSYFDAQQWDELVYNELASGRPVLYTGVSSTAGGHAFVCDGYDGDGYYHINWGWEGSYDGYFLLSVLDYRNNGCGFENSQAMLVGIRPATVENATAPVIAFAGNMELPSTEIDRTTTANVTVRCAKGIFNYSVDEVTLTFGVKLESSNGIVSYAASAATKTLMVEGVTASYTVPASAFPTTGIYRMTPAVRDEAGNWHDAFLKEGNEKAYFVYCEPNDLYFQKESEYIATNDGAEFFTDDRNLKAGIDEVSADAEMTTQEIYTIAGQFVGCYAAGEQPELANGIYVVRQRFADGNVRTLKAVF